MLEVPTIAHVTLTVSHLDRSVQWYERLFDMIMHLGRKSPDHFDGLSGLLQVKPSSDFMSFPIPPTPSLLTNVASVWTTWRSLAEVGVISRPGRLGSTNSVSPTAASSTPTMALRSPAVTRTTSPWNSSLRPFCEEVRAPHHPGRTRRSWCPSVTPARRRGTGQEA